MRMIKPLNAVAQPVNRLGRSNIKKIRSFTFSIIRGRNKIYTKKKKRRINNTPWYVTMIQLRQYIRTYSQESPYNKRYAL